MHPFGKEKYYRLFGETKIRVLLSLHEMTPLDFLGSQNKMESKNKIGFLLSSNTLQIYILKRMIQVAADRLRLNYKYALKVIDSSFQFFTSLIL